jgi:hypothetical protein
MENNASARRNPNKRYKNGVSGKKTFTSPRRAYVTG